MPPSRLPSAGAPTPRLTRGLSASGPGAQATGSTDLEPARSKRQGDGGWPGGAVGVGIGPGQGGCGRAKKNLKVLIEELQH